MLLASGLSPAQVQEALRLFIHWLKDLQYEMKMDYELKGQTILEMLIDRVKEKSPDEKETPEATSGSISSSEPSSRDSKVVDHRRVGGSGTAVRHRNGTESKSGIDHGGEESDDGVRGV